MMSTQRLFILIMLINLLIGIVVTFQDNPRATTYVVLDNQGNVIEQYAYEISDPSKLYSGTGGDNQLNEVTIGNSISWGRTGISVLFNGIKPFPVKASDYNTDIEKVFVYALTAFRWFMYIIVIIEAIMFIKNRKTS